MNEKKKKKKKKVPGIIINIIISDTLKALFALSLP